MSWFLIVPLGLIGFVILSFIMIAIIGCYYEAKYDKERIEGKKK